MHDVLFRGARLIDGSGAPARLADVAVRAGLIVAIHEADDDAARPAARRVVPCEGLVLAPGFILMTLARAEVPRWAEVVKRSGAKMD